MKFEIAHVFEGISPADYESLYFDEEFQNAMSDAVRVARTVTKIERPGGHIVREQRCEPVRDIPAPIAKLLGGRRFAYQEALDFALGQGRGEWRVTPNIAAEKVDARGTLLFEPAPGGLGIGTRRVVRGAIDVSVFGIGGLVERFVVGELEKSYGEAADFTRRHLKEHGVRRAT